MKKYLLILLSIIFLFCETIYGQETTDIPSLDELETAPASDDKIPISDTSDTTQAASGSLKFITVQNFLSGLSTVYHPLWDYDYTDLINKPTIPSTYSDIVAMWASGSCTGYLYSDGTCSAGGSMTYPSGSGIPVVSSGTSWGTTITNLSGLFGQISDEGAFALTILGWADAAAARTGLGLVIGTNVLAPNGDGSSLTSVPQSTSTFGTDNVLLKSDGTSRNMQATGISVDDSNNITGVGTISSSGGVTVAGTSSGPQAVSFKEDTDNGSDEVGIGAPPAITTSTYYDLPGTAPVAGQVFITSTPAAETKSDGNSKSTSQLTLAYPSSTFNATPDGMSDGGYNGDTIIGINHGETVGAIKCVFLASDGKVDIADADAAGEFPAFGLTVNGGDDTDAAIILVKGIVRDEDWTGLTVGGAVYLGDDGTGQITQTAPSTSGDCVQIVGWALSDSEIYFDFSRPYLELE